MPQVKIKFSEELSSAIEAGCPLIHVVTWEEERFFDVLVRIAGNSSSQPRMVLSWDQVDQFFVHHKAGKNFNAKECTSDTLIKHIVSECPDNCIVVLKDFHHVWTTNRAKIVRRIRNTLPHLRSHAKYLIFLTPPLDQSSALPVELKDSTVSLEMPLPLPGEMEAILAETVRNLPENDRPSDAMKLPLVNAALGLSAERARMALRRAWASCGAFNEKARAMIVEFKQQVIRESGALEFWSAEEGPEDVGGLDLMKAWLLRRAEAFGPKAREYGLPMPRGVALIGIPGTGKSLSAKMISTIFKLPLLRLDVGALFGSLLGESEANLRHALMLAETVSPSILWIDEMEKAFAGSHDAHSSSGAAMRVFGSFLTWMQEHTTPVYVVATANNVSALPPELMGRFDRTFFLDLPNRAERRAIFSIHIRKKANIPDPERRFDFERLVDASKKMVGREIEKAVAEAVFTAFDDGNRELEIKDLLAALAETVPLSRSHAEVISKLRAWKTDGRAAPASADDEPLPTVKGRAMEII